MSQQQLNGYVLQAPAETGAVVPPHPQMYDITTDELRAVAQEDFDLVSKIAEEGQLRNLLIRKLLNMDRDKLRQVRKLLDDNMAR